VSQFTDEVLYGKSRSTARPYGPRAGSHSTKTSTNCPGVSVVEKTSIIFLRKHDPEWADRSTIKHEGVIQHDVRLA
jgi:hypothetical protein